MDSAGLVTVDLSVAQINVKSAHISPFQVRVKLGRRIMNQAISQFLPTILINILCYFTNYFEAGFDYEYLVFDI